MLVPVFALTSALTSTNFVISFPAQSGFNYQVQYKDALGDTTWIPLATVPGDDTRKSFSDAVSGSARFYRVLPQ